MAEALIADVCRHLPEAGKGVQLPAVRTCGVLALQAEQGSQNIRLKHADRRAACIASQFDAGAFNGGNDAAGILAKRN